MGRRDKSLRILKTIFRYALLQEMEINSSRVWPRLPYHLQRIEYEIVIAVVIWVELTANLRKKIGGEDYFFYSLNPSAWAELFNVRMFICLMRKT